MNWIFWKSIYLHVVFVLFTPFYPVAEETHLFKTLLRYKWNFPGDDVGDPPASLSISARCKKMTMIID